MKGYDSADLKDGVRETAETREDATGDGVIVSCLAVDVLSVVYLPVKSPRGSVNQTQLHKTIALVKNNACMHKLLPLSAKAVSISLFSRVQQP